MCLLKIYKTQYAIKRTEDKYINYNIALPFMIKEKY